MSLFENERYEWRETYFILFHDSRHPTADAVVRSLNELGRRVEVQNVAADENGLVESLTVVTADDYSAMDISYAEGEEVIEQVAELIANFGDDATDEEKQLMQRLPECTARLEIFFFEQLATGFEPSMDEQFVDPGGLISVLQQLAALCDGVPVDPQSGIVV